MADLEENLEFNSRRSAVYSLHGMVASSQPTASNIGLDLLKKGGNAVDAAIAVSAALAVTEPCSTGIGGDCFMLYFSNSDKKVYGLNGSGRSSSQLTCEYVQQTIGAFEGDDRFHALSVTVPGAIAGWMDALDRWGSMPPSDVLAPAVKLAREGFAVAPLTAYHWKRGEAFIKRNDERSRGALLIDGRAPRAGELFRNPKLADTLERVGAEGAKAFYTGLTAEAIVKCVNKHGGVMALDDLSSHTTTFPEPISVNYKGYEVHQIPPNGQGLVALLAMNIVKGLDIGSFRHNSAPYLHRCIEALRLAFADGKRYIGDPEVGPASPVEGLLSDAYTQDRIRCVLPDRANPAIKYGTPVASSNTVSFQVVDDDGNAVSMVNSNYCGFGTGLIPDGEGFPLQNRGANFCVDRTSPNCAGPRKRPYHTIIPAMVTKDGELWSTYTNMGGFMQPQGHLQLLLDQVEYGMDPQAALDQPRICLTPERDPPTVSLEDGITPHVANELRQMGHRINDGVRGQDRALFGRGQIINRTVSHRQRVWVGGSDGRADGCCMGY
ncbi:unnamed protein product [Vitrella brassicaformis CCMP3155]|uniref:Gamma-glutamyltransferase n=2 Tax=Vitrella brassicaformis TaxID=1169539 RepID=A0A0G4EWX6_VITBC|nr:unnamed protein product [Vitrella brassicaformis CCMP3155]|mmetsp:Transcript_5682/g.16030  ORF Transcript_5682/g.16030 Transcript_5682/m.16030 type:complete len:550 (-) Transcript_5682:1804-3453(-)|eukprot:CEM02584.1 unnamed protein product [Vitrella brassicaformis CCMP3155]